MLPLHRKPKVGEQRIIVVGIDRSAVEFVVVSVLKANAHISPWPHGGVAADERDISDLSNEAVAIRAAVGVRRLATDQVFVNHRVRRSPRIEILTADHNPVVVAVG